MTRMIPLDQLRFGHEATPPINARRVGRDDGVPELATSIGAHGLITALRVKEIDGVPYVGIGNRRLAAMRLLVDRGEMSSDHPVACIDFDGTVDDPREIALAEQIMRVSLHEADQYEEFRALADAGLSEAVIASRFGIEPKRVKRILALGRLSPLVLDWWRAQVPNGNTIDTVRAFTLAPSIEEQERVFNRLAKGGNMWAHTVRSAFGATDRAAAVNVKFVGIDAYTAAGGQVTEDLFGDNHVVSDPVLAAQLANEKLRAKADEIAKEGWSWTALASDLPENWSWNWQKLGLSKKKATKDQKAKSGVVVHIDHEGALSVTYGVVRPAEAKKERAAAGEKKEKGAPTISNAMMHRLSIQVTRATTAALSQEPRIGLIALLAGFLSGQHNGPVKVSMSGIAGVSYGDKESFAGAFTRLQAMSDTDLFAVAAGLAGKAIDMQSQNALRKPLSAGADVLAAAIDADRMTTALREHWDAIDYFTGVAKPMVIQAIREAVNDDEARKADKLKKKELVEFAVKNVQPTGWLPPELRCATYTGPGEAPVLAVETPAADADPELDPTEGDDEAMEAAE